MAMTIQSGLHGGYGNYAYCGGLRETERRKRQIENGTTGFPVWTPKRDWRVKPKRSRKKNPEIADVKISD
jgi:prepilin-type processing-associated H-X9-DG protein